MELQIIPFESRYANIFRDLNLQWLQTYFYVEEKDKLLLENCELNIIERGGFIFFAQVRGVIVGCFALIRLEASVYELGKMAVSPEHQGQQIGQHLMQFAIDYGREQDWKKLVLYSNTILGSAIHIYKKFGFKEVELEANIPYARSNIKMELMLK